MIEKKRFYYLDYYKVYALFMLTFYHFLDFWFTKNTNSFIGSPSFVLNIIQFGTLFSLFSCVTIPLIAGVSFSFQEAGFKKVLKRSFYLILIGYMLNIILYGFTNLYEWDILQAVGFFTIITKLMKKYHKKFLIVGILLLLFSKTISSHYYLNNLSMGKFLDLVLIGDPNGESYYSFIHFYGLYIIGYYLGKDIDNISKNLLKIIAFSALFVPVKHDIFSPTFDNLWSANFFMPKTADMFLFVFLSSCFLLLLIKVDKKVNINPFSKYVVGISKNMTWIYVFHTIIFSYVSMILFEIKDDHIKMLLFVFFGLIQLLFVVFFPYIRDLLFKRSHE